MSITSVQAITNHLIIMRTARSGPYPHITLQAAVMYSNIMMLINFYPSNSSNPELFFFDTDTSQENDTGENIRLCMDLEFTMYNVTIASLTKRTTAAPYYPALRLNFACLPPNIVQLTFKNTTQYSRQTVSAIMKRQYKSPCPANNVHCRDEPVATDTVYSKTPAIDNGSKIAQFFVGIKSMFTDIYGMKTDSQTFSALEE